MDTCWYTGGLLNRARIFPKGILYEILERENARNPSNVHIVYYKRAMHAVSSFPPSSVGRYLSPHYIMSLSHSVLYDDMGCDMWWWYDSSFCSPTQIIRNIRYRNMEGMADVIVEVPNGSSRAIARRQQGRRPPMNWLARQTHSIGVMLIAALLVVYQPSLWPLALFFVVIQYWYALGRNAAKTLNIDPVCGVDRWY
jgi:hypothetical protein